MYAVTMPKVRKRLRQFILNGGCCGIHDLQKLHLCQEQPKRMSKACKVHSKFHSKKPASSADLPSPPPPPADTMLCIPSKSLNAWQRNECFYHLVVVFLFEKEMLMDLWTLRCKLVFQTRKSEQDASSWAHVMLPSVMFWRLSDQ